MQLRNLEEICVDNISEDKFSLRDQESNRSVLLYFFQKR